MTENISAVISIEVGTSKGRVDFRVENLRREKSPRITGKVDFPRPTQVYEELGRTPDGDSAVERFFGNGIRKYGWCEARCNQSHPRDIV